MGGAVVLGIQDTIVQGVPFFAELGSQRVPEFAIMSGLGISNVLEDEVVWP